MKLRYIVDIDIDEEDTEMELALVDDIRNFVRDHEYGCIANGVDVKLQDEYCIGKERRKEANMTQYERIKNMSIDEMTNFLHDECDGVCECCVFNRNANCYVNGDKCKLGIREWLESEIENELEN